MKGAQESRDTGAASLDKGTCLGGLFYVYFSCSSTDVELWFVRCYEQRGTEILGAAPRGEPIARAAGLLAGLGVGRSAPCPWIGSVYKTRRAAFSRDAAAVEEHAGRGQANEVIDVRCYDDDVGVGERGAVARFALERPVGSEVR